VRFRKSVTASVCVFGLGLLAAGCSSGSSSSSSTTPSTSTAPAATSAAPASTAAATSASASNSAQPAASTAACSASGLGFALGTKTGPAGQQTTQVVDLTNKGPSACVMNGFPGVDLVGAANGQQNYSWPLERSSAKYSQVTLPPGGTAHFDLTYLPAAAGDGTDITVAKIVLTPPNTFTQAQLTWSQKVLLQDGATHPGTYIGPVTAGT
jgi:pyruvate/2-oxoglutarate dehydrogenase complex dihydrolipoamide acyltransferase (E2) component